MKTIKELKEWLLNNRVNKNGDLDLSELDFSDFNGYVDISEMKVKGDLHQGNQKVKGNLIQSYQEVEGNLYQSYQKVQGNLHQAVQEVEGDLFQDKIINGKTKAQAIKELEKIYENN